MSRLMKTILVTQGLKPFAQRVAKLLKDCTVVFGTADEIPDILLRTANYVAIPSDNKHTYVHEVLKTCLDRRVDVLLPLGLYELRPIAEAKALFSEYGIAIWVPDTPSLVELAIIENPPRELQLVVLSDENGPLSGVFARSDTGDELALCCAGQSEDRRLNLNTND